MFQVIESIQIENKKLHHIAFHNARWNAARAHYFNTSDFQKIEDFVKIPEAIDQNIYKCRVTSNGIETNFTIEPYQLRSIKSLKVVHHPSIEYRYKTSRREILNELFEKRENCDDILIFRNNLLTDSWAANVLLFDGTNWITPKTPLLKGVQRAVLLHQKKIKEADILLNDLSKFKKIKLVNAMINFNQAKEIPINNIIY